MKEEPVFTLQVTCGPWMVVGATKEGQLRVIPITGGTFTGDINGIVMPGGADWNTQRDQYISHAFAKYVIQTDDGAYIAVENEGIIDDRKSVPFITKPSFQADKNGSYAWLNEQEFVGKLSFGEVENQVIIEIFRRIK